MDYRSQDGLYNSVKEYGVSPEEILSHDFFFRNTEIFYDFYRKYFIIEEYIVIINKSKTEYDNNADLVIREILAKCLKR